MADIPSVRARNLRRAEPPVSATTAGDLQHQHRPAGLASWTATRPAGPAPHQVVPQAPPRPKASLRGCPVLHRPGRVRTANPRTAPPKSPADRRFEASPVLAQSRAPARAIRPWWPDSSLVRHTKGWTAQVHTAWSTRSPCSCQGQAGHALFPVDGSAMRGRGHGHISVADQSGQPDQLAVTVRTGRPRRSPEEETWLHR